MSTAGTPASLRLTITRGTSAASARRSSSAMVGESRSMPSTCLAIARAGRTSPADGSSASATNRAYPSWRGRRETALVTAAPEAPGGGAPRDRLDDRRTEGDGDVRHDEPEVAGVPAGERLCHRLRRVPQLLRGGEHTPPRRRRDGVRAGEHARDRCRGDTGSGRDVAN